MPSRNRSLVICFIIIRVETNIPIFRIFVCSLASGYSSGSRASGSGYYRVLLAVTVSNVKFVLSCRLENLLAGFGNISMHPPMLWRKGKTLWMHDASCAVCNLSMDVVLFTCRRSRRRSTDVLSEAQALQRGKQFATVNSINHNGLQIFPWASGIFASELRPLGIVSGNS